MPGKYRTVVIDPPWKTSSIRHIYNPDRFNHGAGIKYYARNKDGIPYKMMTDKELMAYQLPVQTEKNSCLFMWTINSKLELALEMIKNWGYTFKQHITWVKRVGHNGRVPLPVLNMNGFHRNAELILYATKGRPKIRMSPCLMRLAFEAKTRGHSVKPPEFYEMIRPATPEPRIDIFARRRHKGFDAYGDQVEDAVQEVLLC